MTWTGRRVKPPDGYATRTCAGRRAVVPNRGTTPRDRRPHFVCEKLATSTTIGVFHFVHDELAPTDSPRAASGKAVSSQAHSVGEQVFACKRREPLHCRAKLQEEDFAGEDFGLNFCLIHIFWFLRPGCFAPRGPEPLCPPRGQRRTMCVMFLLYRVGLLTLWAVSWNQ